MQLGCGGGLDFAPMASQLLGVSLRARRDTTQVMLGVSLQARCDTTLVKLIIDKSKCTYRRITESLNLQIRKKLTLAVVTFDKTLRVYLYCKCSATFHLYYNSP